MFPAPVVNYLSSSNSKIAILYSTKKITLTDTYLLKIYLQNTFSGHYIKWHNWCYHFTSLYVKKIVITVELFIHHSWDDGQTSK